LFQHLTLGWGRGDFFLQLIGVAADEVGCMSKPRPIRHGDTCMEQKQCYGQELRLVPTPAVVQILLYGLAYFADKYKILLHEFMYMSNHEHLEFTDPLANRPLFLGSLHSLCARAINAEFGDKDALWSVRPYSAPVLQDPESRLERCVYMLVNAVKAELVRYAWEWPGASSWGLEYGKPITIRRPERFFSKDMPEEVQIVLHRPPGVRDDLDDRELRSSIREEVRRRQGDIAAEVRAAGRTFLGVKRVLRCSRRAVPKARPLFGMHPEVAAGDKELRIAALARNAIFRAEYELTRERRRSGDYTAIYPYGTYLARVRENAPCHGPDS
jgi:putative transposase